MVGLHTAAGYLQKYGGAALAGGVNLMLSESTTGAAFIAGMLTSDGRCKTLDASADGYVRAEACIMIKLVMSDAKSAPAESIILAGSFVNQASTARLSEIEPIISLDCRLARWHGSSRTDTLSDCNCMALHTVYVNLKIASELCLWDISFSWASSITRSFSTCCTDAAGILSTAWLHTVPLFTILNAATLYIKQCHPSYTLHERLRRMCCVRHLWFAGAASNMQSSCETSWHHRQQCYVHLSERLYVL